MTPSRRDFYASRIAKVLGYISAHLDEPLPVQVLARVAAPEATEPNDFRHDIGSSLTGELEDNELGVVAKTIPAGKCARVRHFGSTDARSLGKTVQALYGEWLPDSGEELRDYPCMLHFVRRMPTVSE